jgi:hypothetical protein
MGAAVAGAAAVYAGIAAAAWWRFGSKTAPQGEAGDVLLDRFMPVFDIREQHSIAVAAPAAITLQAAGEMDLQDSAAIRVIFRAREIALGATPDERARPKGLLASMRSLGWGELADVPDREIVMGAVTRPWQANVVFRAVPPEAFRAFDEPDFVKIVWTLRADPAGASASVFRTETRAVCTDPEARRKFRRYWAFVSPGIVMIRWLLLSPLKREAERRAAS